MSHRSCPGRWLRGLLVATVLGLLSMPVATAGAAARYEEFDLPSAQGNIDLSVAKLNKVDKLMATVRLPDGYDADPNRAWPVLYLLQGIGDNSRAWAFAGTGNLESLVGNLPAIVVMPEGGRGFFVDWWRGGARSGVNWMSYMLDEVLPTVESRYRIKPGRQNHAIGGPSMGGYGALVLAGQLPGYFGSVISMSGLVDPQSVDSATLLPGSIGASYDDVWGPILGPYAGSLNPTQNAQNLRGSRVYLSTGNGIPSLQYPFLLNAWTKGVAIETLTLAQTTRYDLILGLNGVQHVTKYRGGVHDWPYWRRELPTALAWNPFAAPPITSSNATSWSYRTMQTHGNAWGLGYRFQSPPTTTLSLKRTGQILSATGRGTVTISPGAAAGDASGRGTRPDCSFTAPLPFAWQLPDGC
jgi:S-formylglutathione hydrolase FrmB